jgi:CNT family concentrative nucleoside transporter
MTAAEIHQVMASGFSTIAGSVLTAYVAMGIPAVYLISGESLYSYIIGSRARIDLK